jgi:hypothetical protein
MGLGGSPSEWDEYEWVRLADLPAPRSGRRPAEPSSTGYGLDWDAAGPLAEAICDQLDELQIWPDTSGDRVLLVDLDNLRAGPMHWRARMSVIAALARQADHVVLAGQGGAVARARPHLAEYADRAQAVSDGSDVADHVLLNAAAKVGGNDLTVLVVSNDGIFAGLADRGSLIVLSPGADALSDRLRDAADRTIDLAALEKQLDAPVPAQRTARTTAARKATTRKATTRKAAVKNATARKTAVRKAAVGKTTIRKQVAGKQVAAKQVAAKQVAAKQAPRKQAAALAVRDQPAGAARS